MRHHSSARQKQIEAEVRARTETARRAAYAKWRDTGEVVRLDDFAHLTIEPVEVLHLEP